MIYPKGTRSLVDADLLAKVDETYQEKLLQADNVFIKRNGNLTRRPPLAKRSFKFEPGEILDAKSTKDHYVILRRVDPNSLNPASTAFRHVTFNQDTLRESYSFTDARRVPVNYTKDYLEGQTTQIQALSTALDRSSDTYTFTPDSDLVAIDFYDKETGTLNKKYSKLFGIHKPKTSEIPGGHVKESNRLIATASGRETSLEGGENEAVLIGVYSNYTDATDTVEDLKFIPPLTIPLSTDLVGFGTFKLQDLLRGTGFICYRQDYVYNQLAHNYIEQGEGHDLELKNYEFISNSYKDANVKGLNIYDDNVIFTFCGLGYVISKTGEIRCIHSDQSILPTIGQINQDTIRTYPLGREINKEPQVPIKIYLRKATEPDESGSFRLQDEEEMTREEFINKYPQYSSILSRLTQVVSYVPIETLEGYSDEIFYCMPDIKILVPTTDISADCKYITKGDTPYDSAWFGVPTMREAYLSRKGWMTVTDDKKFPYDHGISAGGVGCSAALFKRNEVKERVDINPTIKETTTDENGVTSTEERPGGPSLYIIPKYLDRAMKQIFDGEVIDVPPEYINYIKTREEQLPPENEGMEDETPPAEEENEDVKFGLVPSIPFYRDSYIVQGEKTLSELQDQVKSDKMTLNTRYRTLKSQRVTTTLRQVDAARRQLRRNEEALNEQLYKNEGLIAFKTLYTSNDQMEQLDAYIHIELDYASQEFNEFFNEKDLMCLPSSNGQAGYAFEIFKKGGETARAAIESTTNYHSDKICEFQNGLGYVMPLNYKQATAIEINAGITQSWLRYFTMYKRVNLLRDKPVAENILLGPNAPPLFISRTKISPTPLRFSAAGTSFPLSDARLTYTNVRNMFYSGNELSVSGSEDLQANVFYEPLKYYFQYIRNQSLSPVVFLQMGLHNYTIETEPETDPNFFTSVTKGGQADPIKEIVLLDDRLVIHTNSGLSTITADFNVLNRFAEIEITTNLIKDGTAIIGAKENKVYLTGYSHEKRGYAVEDINKELRGIVPIDYIVDMLDAQRVALLFPEKGNVLYVLSQETDRRFKGFTRFLLPIEVIHAFREDFNKVLLVDKNSNIYSMDLNTNRDTKYEDNYVDDDGVTRKANIISDIRQTPLLAIDSERSTVFTEQTVGRLAIGIHGVPKFNLEYISEGKDKVFKKEIPFVMTPREGLQQTPGPTAKYCTTKTKTVITRTVLCNTKLWSLEEDVDAFGIDFTRRLVLLLSQNKMKLRRLLNGDEVTDLPVWGDYASEAGKDAIGIQDIKYRTDYNSNFVDYTPYTIDNRGSLASIDYNAGSNSMIEREVYSGSGITKRFCFISDNIIAVLIGSVIKIIDIKKIEDNELSSLDLSELLPGQTVLGLDSIDSSYIIVTTNLGLYRIKISSMSLVRGDNLLFSNELAEILQGHVGCVYKDSDVYVFKNGLHKIDINRRSTGVGNTDTTDNTEIEPTSEIEDPPECGIPQTPIRVTLIDGHTTSTSGVTNPVDTGTGDAPGNIAIDVSDREETAIGSENTMQVSPGEAGAFAIGVRLLKLSILTRSAERGINNHPYTFTNANPPVFTEGDSEQPHSSIEDIKAIMPIADDKYVITGSGEVVLFSNGNAPENLQHSSMPDRVEVASIQDTQFLMLSGRTIHSYQYSPFFTIPYAPVTIRSSAGIIAMFIIGLYIFIVRRNEIEVINRTNSEPANLFNGGTTSKIPFSATAAAYYNNQLWFLDGGEVKRKDINIRNSSVPGTEEVILTTPSGESEILDGGGRSGESTIVFNSAEDRATRQGYKSKAPLFWSRIFKLDKDWNASGRGILYSNGLGGLGRYRDRFLSSIFSTLGSVGMNRYNNYGMPAMPNPTYMFVDEYRVNSDANRPFFGGQGHFPECIATDGDHLYIPYDHGDIIPYNIKDKSYGFNRGRYQIDPVMGSKLAYPAPFFIGTSSSSIYRFMFLFDLLSIRAGIVYNTRGVGDRNKVLPTSSQPTHLGGYMGGVTAMTASSSNNNIRRFYGISKAYNKENGWESLNTASTRAKNSGRKTGRTLNRATVDSDPEGILSFDRKPYIIYESADHRDLTRTWPSGDAKNNNIWDSDWNLTGGEGVDARGKANIQTKQRLGQATFSPSFRERDAAEGDADARFYFGAYDDDAFQAILTGANYRADPRYKYRILSSSRFPAGGKITCMFNDGTDLYVVIQPPQSANARMWKIAIADMATRGFAPQDVSNYEDASNWKRPIAKTTALMETTRWFEVRVNTTDYGDMVAKGEYDKMPHLQYFDSIDYDAKNDLFVGLTAWSIYVFDKSFNFKVQKPLFGIRQPNSYEKGYHKAIGLLDDKIQAKCVDTKAKKIYLLKRHFEERSSDHFWVFGDTTRTFSTNRLEFQDTAFGTRAVNTLRREFNIGGAYRYLWNEFLRRFEPSFKAGMSIPFVTTLNYSLTKRTTPRTNKKHVRLGGTESFDVNVTVPGPPTPDKPKVFNIVSLDVTRGIIRAIAEDIDRNRYCKAAAININEGTGERKSDLEVSLPDDERPLKIASLDGKVYIAVDDLGECKELDDDVEVCVVKVSSDDDDDDDKKKSTYLLTYICSGTSTTNQQLPDPDQGNEWAFDTGGEGIGIFREVKRLAQSDITNTLIPVDKDGVIQYARLPELNRYLVANNVNNVCMLPDSLKKKPEPPKRNQCPIGGHSLKLSEFCGSRRINSDCKVYVYSTELAEAGTEPTVTGYPIGHRVSLSEDVAIITSEGVLLRGGSRFADSIAAGVRVCGLPPELKKKYKKPPIQDEYTLDEICEQRKLIDQAPSGKQWYFVTPSDTDQEGTFKLLNSGLSTTNNRVPVYRKYTTRYEIYISNPSSFPDTNRYFNNRYAHACQWPLALKKGTGVDPITEYTLREICGTSGNIRKSLPAPESGKRWYFVTVTGNLSYGKFKQLDTTQINDDEHVALNNQTLRPINPRGRYSGITTLNVCEFTETLKRGKDTRGTQFTYNEICSGSSSLYAPVAGSGKFWYFVTTPNSRALGKFVLEDGQNSGSHRVEVDTNARVTSSSTTGPIPTRYARYRDC